MKLYVHHEEDVEKPTTLKFTLPKKWLQQPVQQVIELFIENYNAKNPDVQLDKDVVHLEKSNGEVLRPSDIVEKVLLDRNDVYVKPGAVGPSKGSNEAQGQSKDDNPTSNAEGGQRCRNYGCSQMFTEESNTENSCSYHTAPPVFHDTKKGWSCCAKRVYDWDEFHKIEGCAVGRHSTIDPKAVFAQSPTVTAAAEAELRAPQMPLKSIADYNKANPSAASAAKSAVSMVQKPPTSTIKADGCTATCLNKGCQKDFLLADNHAAACRFHSAAPVFHDAGKWWGCCPQKVKYDFDAFLEIPGCMVGWHHDGTSESDKRLEEAKKADE